eukprot:6475284-Amphidinium_carterae.2
MSYTYAKGDRRHPTVPANDLEMESKLLPKVSEALLRPTRTETSPKIINYCFKSTCRNTLRINAFSLLSVFTPVET